MEFTLTIELGNDAMQTGRDIAATLRTVALVIGTEHAATIKRPIHTRNVRDVNGNTIGSWRIADPVDTRYNGHTNYETWSVALFIDNESNECIAEARDAAITGSSALKEWFTEYFTVDPSTDEPVGNMFTQQLVSAALADVDWYSLVEHYTAED